MNAAVDLYFYAVILLLNAGYTVLAIHSPLFAG